MTQIDYRQMAAELLAQASGQTQKAAGTTPSTNWGNGRGGLFASPGLSKPLFSAMILPRMGVAAGMPVRTVNYTDPLEGIITGVTDTSGSEPTNVCDDPPTAGVTKLCTHSFVFGRFSRQSQVINIDRVGEITNRGEFSDFDVYGDPFGGSGNGPSVPNVAGGTLAGAVRGEASKKLFELGVSWSRDFARITYTGDPANNTAGDGYKEFYGLDTLVNTGYRDAETGIACPAADAIMRDFGGVDIDGNGATLVREITHIYRNLKYLARHANLDPLEIRIAMTFGAFYAITDLWPCAYMSYRCSPETGSTNFIDSGENERMRDAMRGNLYDYTGQYLLIDGQKVPVIIDDAITETQPVAGQFNSDIYFLPFSVLGRQQTLFWESFNFEGANGSMEAAKIFAPGGSFYTTDGGRFLWHRKAPSNWCVQVVALTKPRIKLLTPYLSARLQNVRYTPLIHERSWDPDASFFYNGGKTAGDTTQPSYYSPTA